MTSPEPNRAALSRRALLAGSAGAVVAAGAVAALWPSEHTRGAQNPPPEQKQIPPEQKRYPVTQQGHFTSAARGGVETNWIIQRPEGVTTVLHPVIVLPDKGDAALPDAPKGVGSPFQRYGLPEALTNAVPNLAAPFALCAVDGMVNPNGSDSYYHPRSVGGKTVDSGKMVLEEFLPRLADLGLDISKVAFWGWTMGGYAALRLGALYNQQNPGKVAGVVAVSPALGLNSPPDAESFDGSDDYRLNSVWNQAILDELGKIPLRIDVGSAGTYIAGDRQLITRLAPKQVEGGVDSGSGDSDTFFRTLVPAELQFLGKCFGPKR